MYFRKFKSLKIETRQYLPTYYSYLIDKDVKGCESDMPHFCPLKKYKVVIKVASFVDTSEISESSVSISRLILNMKD